MVSKIKYVGLGNWRNKSSKVGFVKTLYSFYQWSPSTVANQTHTAYVHTRKPATGESIYGLPTKNLGEFGSFKKAEKAILEAAAALV